MAKGHRSQIKRERNEVKDRLMMEAESTKQ